MNLMYLAILWVQALTQFKRDYAARLNYIIELIYGRVIIAYIKLTRRAMVRTIARRALSCVCRAPSAGARGGYLRHL